MKSSKYWQERFEQLQEAQLKDAELYVAELEKSYQRAMVEIERDIYEWYARFAKNQGIGLREVRRYLNSDELTEFKWTVEEFIEKGKENALDQRWMRELENASARVHISALEVLSLKMKQHIEVLTARQIKGFDELAVNLFSDRYYKSAYELQLGFNVGWELAALNVDMVETLIKQPWAPDGKDFSARVWDNRTRLIGVLEREITQSVIRGESPARMIKAVADQMNVSRRAASRLVMTESAFFVSAGQKKAFEDLDVERYIYVATLDLKTSEMCQEMDGRVFPMSEYQPGITAPPLHVYCRSVTAPYFADLKTTRFARKVDGKTHYVPGDMTYSEWKDKYVGAEYDQTRKQVKNAVEDKKQFKRYKSVLGEKAPVNFDDFSEMKYNKGDEWQSLKSDYRKINAYNRIIAAEPDITNDLKKVERLTDAKLVGLDYRLKSVDSYLRKVKTDSQGSLNSVVIDDTIAKTNDVIRYTYQSDANTLVDKYFEVCSELDGLGYKLDKTKNFWLSKSNPYNGINCIFKSPKDQNFEVQFHTPDSFDLKNGEMHKMYENMRADETKPEEKADLIKKMWMLSNQLEVPRDINRIKG